jgi:hypothetical protein
MSMGNYLMMEALQIDVMATSKTPLGVNHTTVVPENFDPETGDREEPPTNEE